MSDADTSHQFDVEQEEQENLHQTFDSHVFWRMLAFTRPYRGRILAAAGLILFRTLISVVEPVLIAVAINEGITKENPTAILHFGVALLGIALFSLLAGHFQNKILGEVGQHILYDIRSGLFHHIQSLSFDFFDSRPVGRIVTRLTDDAEKIAEMLSTSLINMATQLVSLVCILCFMFALHAQLALRSMLLLPFIVVFIWAQRGPLEGMWMSSRRAFSNLNAHINETVTGMTIIQAFTREAANARTFEALNKDIVRKYMRPVIVEIIGWPLIDFLYACANGLIFWYGASEMIAGRLDAGTIVAFIQYQGLFWSPITTFGRNYSQMLSAMASARRVFEFMDYPVRVADIPHPAVLPPIQGKVEFDHVHFAYQDNRPVLNDIHFCVQPGMHVALVGPTGAGKSTIVNLVARFYDPSLGCVRIDDQDIRQYSLHSLRSQLGIVLQDTFIFAGTIRENIAYGRPDASEQDIIAAAQAAQAHEFIMALPQGYDTVTEERGASLSLGQRQLLSFARAILTNPRILLLDEATSSVDAESETHIQHAMQHLLRDRTAFIIAHRLATIHHADLILVIENGCIQEAGTHQELLARRGTYFRLHETQFLLHEQLMSDWISTVN